MTKREWADLHMSLTRTIQQWIDGPAPNGHGLGYWYPEIAADMADAAICVLKGSQRAQACYIRHSPLTTDLTEREVSSARMEAARDFH